MREILRERKIEKKNTYIYTNTFIYRGRERARETGWEENNYKIYTIHMYNEKH